MAIHDLLDMYALMAMLQLLQVLFVVLMMAQLTVAMLPEFSTVNYELARNHRGHIQHKVYEKLCTCECVSKNLHVHTHFGPLLKTGNLITV